MAKKKNNQTLIIIGVVLVIFFFLSRGVAEVRDVGTQDKGVSFKVFAYDENKNLIGQVGVPQGATMATIQFPGGEPQDNVNFIRIESTILALGDVPTEVSNIIGSNTNGPNVYGPAISDYDKSFSLSPGTSNVQTSDFIDVTVLDSGDVTFRLDVSSHFFDAFGNLVDSSTFGTVIVIIFGDTCSDGTPVGQCSSENRGKFCDAGDLVDQASVCDCCTSVGETSPCGWEPNPDNPEVCYDELCGTGIHAGQCTGLDTQYPQFCQLDGELTDACNECGPCAIDYQNNDATGCSVPTDPAVCEYQEYAASINVELGTPGGDGTQSTVFFRTTSLSYAPFSKVGFTASCGEDLTGYGRSFQTCSELDCDESAEYNNLPGGAIMWIRESTQLCICSPSDVGTSSEPRVFSSNSPFAGDLPLGNDPLWEDNELLC